MEVMEDLLTQLRSTLEDDSKDTRLIACRIMLHLFTTVGRDLDQDRLHNIYPDLLKRLDDSSDDIRIAAARAFSAYMDCFRDNYDVILYRAHIEAIYSGLLVHLDDPDGSIQQAISGLCVGCRYSDSVARNSTLSRLDIIMGKIKL
jgi:dynein assembly factor 5, axonemal